ncbi:MAG: FGGY-family carbohydrate kinase [archaeon]|nr:FGGY-family carbohydrate kinase [archaeon]
MAGKNLFLGIDCGTQSLKLEVYEGGAAGELRLVDGVAVHYQVATEDDHLEVGEDGAVTTDPLVWAAALDGGLQALKGRMALSRVAAVGGSGQQHGSVYWKKGSRELLLRGLDAGLPLAEQLRGAFSVERSPIWMDSSTTAQCRSLCDEAFEGDPQQQAEATGSGLYERFSGNQLLKIAQARPHLLLQTERISLVSSFVCSLFLGDYAPIDHSDASGTSLFHLPSRSWHSPALQAASAGLLSPEALSHLLGTPSPPLSIAGTVSPYFQHRYGFSPDCLLSVFSGDNPCTVAGLRLTLSSSASPSSPSSSPSSPWALSLGTSDTLLALTATPHPHPLLGHVMASPLDPSHCMVMLCYKNGSHARHHLLRRWLTPASDPSTNDADVFAATAAALSQTPAGAGGFSGFYFPQPEIFPPLACGLFRFSPEGLPVASLPSPAHDARALFEGRFVSMRAHARRIGMAPPSRVLVTGGGSQAPAVLQIIADVFQAPVYTLPATSNGAALGAAFLAFLVFHRRSPADPSLHPLHLLLACSPSPSSSSLFTDAFLDRHSTLEQQLLQISPSPFHTY